MQRTRGIMGNALGLSFCVVRIVRQQTKNDDKLITDETFLKGGD